MAEESKVLGVRLETAEKEKFESYVKEEGRNNKEFLGTLLNLYELNKSKVKNISLVGDIEQLEKHTNLIHKCFTDIIGKLEDQKQDIVFESDSNLKIYKEKVNNSEEQLAKFKQENIDVKNELTSVNNVLLTLQEQNKSLNESLKDKTSLVEEYKGKNDMILSQLKQYEKYPEQLEEYKKLLSYSQTEVMNLENTLKDKYRDIKTIEDKCNAFSEAQKVQQAEFKNTLATKIEQHKTEINQMREKEEFNKEKALLNKDKEYQVLINKINAENNKKIKELLHENQEYNSKFSNLMEESQNKTGEINRLNGVIEKIVAEDYEKEIKINELRSEIEKLTNSIKKQTKS